MNGPRSPEWRQPFGYFCYTLRAYSNAKCQRHLFDEAHRSGSGEYPAQTFHFLADPVLRPSRMGQCRAPAAENAAVSFRFNFGRHPTAIF
jgi:hypothetical protein